MPLASNDPFPVPTLPDPAIPRQDFLGVPFDRINFDAVVELIEEKKGAPGFRYIVTPNVDHIVRLSGNEELMTFYRAAWLTLCDSKPVTMLARAMAVRLPRVTGSDLTVCLFGRVIRDGDRVTLIAPNHEVVERMRARFPGLVLRAHVPPFGVSENPAELARCIDFAVATEADFIFVAIGSPQSETIAYAMSKDPRSSGTCLCVGASLEFLTGMKKRAPRWMSKIGIEWLHRLASDPKRLWRRYVYAVLPLSRLALVELRQRYR